MKITILYVGAHHKYPYIVQMIHGADNSYCFQYFIHDDGKFYQGHNIITSQVEGAPLTDEEIAKAVPFMQDMAVATIEELRKQKDPTYKLTDEQKMGADVVDVMENMEKADKEKKAKEGSEAKPAN